MNERTRNRVLKLLILSVVIIVVIAAILFVYVKNKRSRETVKEADKKTALITQSASEKKQAQKNKKVKTTKTPTPTPCVIDSIENTAAGTILNENELDLDKPEKYFKSLEISDEVFERIYGDNKSYKTYCTVPREDLRYLKMLHRGFDGKVHVGEMIVNKAISDEILEIFTILFQNDYQIEKMVLVDDYDADDKKSIDDNNSSAFNYRAVTDNPSILSYHGMGVAIDINPINNPYIWSDGSGGWEYEDRDADKYLDRYAEDAAQRHMINHNDLCYKLFTERGYTWGGDWSDPIDYQHFEKPIVDYPMG